MSAQPNPMPTSQADKAKLADLLHQTRERFLQSFADVSEEECRRHPEPGQWSVLDVVEHIAIAETVMLNLINGTRRPKTADRANREEAFLRAVADRSRKMQSPEPARPAGRFASLSEARTQFESSREGAIRFVGQCEEDLRATEVTHPHPAAGVVTTYEMLIIMAKHAERHALQIEEIKSSPAIRTGTSARG